MRLLLDGRVGLHGEELLSLGRQGGGVEVGVDFGSEFCSSARRAPVSVVRCRRLTVKHGDGSGRFEWVEAKVQEVAVLSE
jgi:hypothetical protein